ALEQNEPAPYLVPMAVLEGDRPAPRLERAARMRRIEARAVAVAQFNEQEIGALAGRPPPETRDQRWRGADACLRALSALAEPHDGERAAFALAPSVRLVDGVVVTPDVAAWRGEARGALHGEIDATVQGVIPNLCVDVLTPATARDARLIKLGLYAQ